MLAERLKSALPLIAIVCLAFFAPMAISQYLFFLLAAAMIYFACQELFTMILPDGKTMPLRGIFTALGLFILIINFPPIFAKSSALAEPLEIIATLTAMVAAFLTVFRYEQTREHVSAVLISIGGAAFLIWSLTFLIKLFYTAGSDSRLLLFYVILITKMADVGAFAAGSTTAKRPGGNHKLSPMVSPKKSWEGLLGGTLTSLAVSLIFFACLKDNLLFGGTAILNWVDAVILGILASVIGLLGDLCESSLKRAANMKDSGKLPGIGGILDTLDSLLPMGPLCYAYFLLKLYC